MVLDYKIIGILEYFFNQGNYETVLVTVEVLFLLIQELFCNYVDIAMRMSYSEHAMVRDNLCI